MAATPLASIQIATLPALLKTQFQQKVHFYEDLVPEESAERSTIFWRIYYSSLGNCRRPTLFQNGTQNGRATLKNCATLISSAPRRDVCDALKRYDANSIPTPPRGVRCFFTTTPILRRAQRGNFLKVHALF